MNILANSIFNTLEDTLERDLAHDNGTLVTKHISL